MPKSIPPRFSLLLAVVFLALASAPAHAAEVYPSVSPQVLRGPAPWRVDYSFEFDAGPVAERIGLSIDSSNGFYPEPVLDGPGTLSSGAAMLLGGGRTCASGFGDIDFGVSGGGNWTLALPAGARTIVRVPVRISRRFGLDEQRADDVRFYVDGTQVSIAGPELAVSREVPLSVGFKLPARLTYAQPGQRVPIVGHTSPMLAGQAIDIRAAHSVGRYVSKPQYVLPVARVRVAADGSFKFRDWRPTTPGRWSVSAFYDSHDARFLDSTMSGCFPGLQVGPPPAVQR